MRQHLLQHSSFVSYCLASVLFCTTLATTGCSKKRDSSSAKTDSNKSEPAKTNTPVKKTEKTTKTDLPKVVKKPKPVPIPEGSTEGEAAIRKLTSIGVYFSEDYVISIPEEIGSKAQLEKNNFSVRPRKVRTIFFNSPFNPPFTFTENIKGATPHIKEATSEMFALLKHFPKTEVLLFHWIKLPSPAKNLAVLKKLKAVKYLHCNNTNFNDACLQNIIGMKELHSFYCQETKLTDVGMEVIGTNFAQQLERLCIEKNDMSDAGVKSLSKLEKLKWIHLCAKEYHKITDDSIHELETMARRKSLTEIKLGRTAMEDGPEDANFGLPKLKRAIKKTNCTVSYETQPWQEDKKDE